MGIVSSLVAIGFSTFWASTIVYTAASIGLSFLAQKLAGKPKIDQAEFGVKGQLQRGADVPQAFIIGKYATAGSLTYANTSGSENKWMTWVITLSDMPVKSLDGIWVNGEKRTIDAHDGPWKKIGGFGTNLQLRFYDGTQTSADPWVTNEVSSSERPFDASAVGTGKAYVVVRAWLDQELFRNGFPQFLFEVEGIPLYNPAKDTSVGGSGAQRWDNHSTWQPSENPAVQLYNILRGIEYTTDTTRKGGLLRSGDGETSLSGMDTLSFTAVGGGGGAVSPSYGGENGDNHPAVSGSAGSATTVTLRDGATVIKTWTAAGGAGGLASVSGDDGPDPTSSLSPMGDGAASQWKPYWAGPSSSGGAAGATLEVSGYDISGLSNPTLTVTGGAGGPGGRSGGSRAAGDGSAGGASFEGIGAVAPESDWFYGLQDVTEAQLPATDWIAQINKCATQINGADGLEPLYRSSAEIPVSAQIHEVIGSLLDACSGRLSDAGGVYKLFAGEPFGPVAQFSDADIISTSEQSFTPFLGLSDTVNGVTAKYPAPAAGWQTETAPPYYRSDYEEADGGRRLLISVDLDFVPYAEQAQRLMKSALEEARRARRHTITLPPEYWTVEAGDTVSWTSERNGYVNKQFRVDGIVDMPDADVLIDITEVDPSDYDWDSNADFTPPAIPGVEDQPIPVQEVQDFAVEAASVKDASGNGRRPAIRATWNGGVEDVRAIKFEIREAVTKSLIDPATSETVSDGRVYISAGVLPATAYEVRAKFIPASPRPVDWTVWRTVTTFDIRLGNQDISDETWDDIGDDARAIAEDVLEQFEITKYLPRVEGMEVDIDQWQIDQITISDAIDTANDNIMDALLLVSANDTLIRDAGVYVDPQTSEVKISGVEANAGRIGQAEIRLSGAESAINLRATEVYVDNAITNAVLDPSQVPIIGNLETRVSNVEIDMNAAENAITLKADQTTVNGYGLRLDQAEIDIDALDGRITLKVDQTEFDDVETRIQTAEQELSLIDGPAITQTVADTRYLYDRMDQSTVTDLEGLLNAYEGREELKTDIAYATQEMRATVDDERQATASIVQALGAAIDSNEALIEAERIVRANETSANAQDITTLVSRVGDTESDISGQADAISDLVTEVGIVDGRVTASASDITQLQSQVDDVDTLAGGNATAIGGLSTRVSNAEGEISSQASSLTNLSTTVGGHTTSIAQAAASINGINAEYTLRIDNNGVVSGMVLRSDLDDAGKPTTAASFVADKFAIVSPTGARKTEPFVVYTTPQTIGGVNVPAGVYIKDAQIRNAGITSAKIADAAIGRAKVTNVIQSDNYSQNAQGIPTSGMRLNFVTGEIKAHGSVISRPMVLANGSFSASPVTNGKEYTFVNTGIRVSANDVWRTNNVALVAHAAITSGAAASGSLDPNNTFWSAEASVMTGARWDGFGGSNPQPSVSWRKDPATLVTPYWATGSDQRVYLRIMVTWEGQIAFPSATIAWKVFQVT